jgi:hypothetical protein
VRGDESAEVRIGKRVPRQVAIKNTVLEVVEFAVDHQVLERVPRQISFTGMRPKVALRLLALDPRVLVGDQRQADLKVQRDRECQVHTDEEQGGRRRYEVLFRLEQPPE